MKLLKNKNDWLEYKKIIENRLSNYPFNPYEIEPQSYPCYVEGYITSTGNKYKINMIYFNKQLAKNLLKV